MLKIGEKIKELRKTQNVTQEKLADYLSISYQAVSKWENGLALPDVSLIPALSNFFGVSSDFLLGIEPNKNEEINMYINQANACSHTGELEKGITIIRKGLQSFPNNHNLLFLLIDFLFGLYCINQNDNYVKEIIQKSELILQDCTDEDIRIKTIEILAYSYNHSEQQEKAIETANKMPSAVINRNHLLANIIMPMSERRKMKQECMLADFEVLINEVLWLGGLSVGKKEYDYSIEVFKRAIELIKAFSDEGLFSLRLAGAYSGMAMAYSGKNDTNTAFEYIEKARKSYCMFEETLLKKKVQYKSHLLNDLFFENENLHTNTNIIEDGGEYAGWYHNLCEGYIAFDAVRKDKRFKALCQSIENDIEYYKTQKRKILK